MAASGTPSVISRESLQQLFAGAQASPERLPMLRVALEKTGSACAEELRNTLAMPVRLPLQGIESGIAGDLFGQAPGASAIGMLQAPGWGARLLVSADRDAILTILEIMLGGDGSQAAGTDGRPITRIETRIAGIFFEAVARALGCSFASIAATTFAVEGTEETVNFDIVDRQEAMVAARFRLEVPARGGEVVIAIPRAALDPMRKALSHAAPREAARPDPGWSQQIEKEVTRASVVLSAVLDECPSRLGAISNLGVGQIIELKATPLSRVRVECNGERLMWCHLGKSNGVYTLRVDGFVDREQEFMEDILSA